MGRDDRDVDALSSELAARWVAVASSPAFDERSGSLVSADLSGFTALSERLARRGKVGAEELTLTVNRCFTSLIGAAEAEGGDVLKFGGDALLIWFEGDGHPTRAARAAAAMQGALSGRGLRSIGLRMSVGVESGALGLVLAGRRHRDLVVIGPLATAVTRLEGEAEAGEILLGPRLLAAIEPGGTGLPRPDGSALLEVPPPPVPVPPGAPPAAIGATEELVPPLVLHHLAALRGATGEHRLATVAFIGLGGTDAAMAGDPAGTAARLDALVGELERLAERHGVMFLYSDAMPDGEKLIVVGGAPVTTGDDEESVLRCARGLLDGPHGAGLRIGVHRGHVFAGFLGSESRRTYTVMGDPVNVAARLMGKAAPGQLIASAATLRVAGGAFSTEPLEPLTVKGKSAPIEASLVGSIGGGADRAPFDVFAMVGRGAERTALSAAVAAAAGGRGVVVEIVGDAGIGKTRLARELAGDRGVEHVVWADCQAYERLTAYAALRRVVGPLVGLDGRSSPEESARRLSAWVAETCPDQLPWLPLLALAAGVPSPPTPEVAALAEEHVAARLAATVLAALTDALPRPSALVVEDVHYADAASLEVLSVLARAAADRPWVVCATRRPESAVDLGPSVTRLELALLPGSAARELAEVASRSNPMLEADLDAVLNRAGGNPLFILELVGAAGLGADPTTLPDTIERLVAARIDQLAPVDRLMLRHAAVVGRSFALDVVEELVAGLGVRVDQPGRWAALEEFVREEADGTFTFRHALFRDVSYESLPFRRRRELHEQVGLLLERERERRDVDVGLLALHFARAGVRPRAWAYSVEAATRAVAVHALAEAAEQYRHALDAARVPGVAPPEEVAAVAEALGDVLERRARFAPAEQAYRRAARWARGRPEAWARLLRKRGVLRERAAQYPQALTWYGRGLRALDGVEGRGPRAEAVQLELAYAGVRFRQGRFRDCVRWAERALAEARALDDDLATAHALKLCGNTGDFGHDEKVARQSAVLFEAADDRAGAAGAWNNVGVSAYFAGRWDVAIEAYERAADDLAVVGDVVQSALARNNLAEVLSDQGAYDDARRAFEQIHRTFVASDYLFGVSIATGNLGRLEARSGDPARGRHLLEEARAGFERIGASAFALEMTARLAECDVLAGRLDGARAEAAAVLAAVAGGVELDGTTTALAHRAEGWALLGVGDRAAAVGAFTTARADAEAAGAPFDVALARLGLAAAGRGGSDEQAERTLAGDVLAGLGVRTVPELGLSADSWPLSARP